MPCLILFDYKKYCIIVILNGLLNDIKVVSVGWKLLSLCAALVGCIVKDDFSISRANVNYECQI